MVENVRHEDLIVFDGLVLPNWGRDGREHMRPDDNARELFESMRKGGLTAANCSCSVWEDFEGTMRKIAMWKMWLRTYGNLIRLCRTTEDIRAAKREGRVGIVLGWQNTSAVEDQIHYLELFYELGIRVVQLTYNSQNLVGSGCYEATDSGLSDFGRELVRELNRLHIAIDLSHVGPKTCDDAIRFSEAPVCYSHVAPRALKNHQRNKTDAQLRTIVERGGFVGVTMFPPFTRNGSDSTLGDYIEALEYVINLVGEESVGVGTDFGWGNPHQPVYWTHDKGYARQLADFGPKRFPSDLQGYADYPNITKAMLERGWSRSRIRKIWGESWLGFLGRVWGA
jgi:membrane dipeptidase